MSWTCLTNCFLKLQGTIINLGYKLTVFKITVSETVVTKIYTLWKIPEGSISYLSFLIMYVGGIYFINHKTNEYVPEGAVLLNLSVSTLNEKKEP